MNSRDVLACSPKPRAGKIVESPEPKEIRKYSLFGCVLQSQWEFDPRCHHDNGAEAADIELIEGPSSLFGEVRAEAGIKPAKGAWFQFATLRDGSYYLLCPGLYEFLISGDGRRISCRQHGKSSWEAFQTYLLGQVLSFALLKQGIESLHCTALITEQGAVGFIADCGQGKSSLAAAFLKAGYPLLTDDLLVVKEEHGGFLAYPSFPRIKLFPRVARAFLGERVSGAPMNPYTKKLIIPLGLDLSCAIPAPLKAIYVLRGRPANSRCKGISIRTLSRRRAFLDLTAHTFNSVIKEPERIKRQFALNAKLTATIPIKSLSYPRNLSRLPDVVQRILLNLVK